MRYTDLRTVIYTVCDVVYGRKGLMFREWAIDPPYGFWPPGVYLFHHQRDDIAHFEKP